MDEDLIKLSYLNVLRQFIQINNQKTSIRWAVRPINRDRISNGYFKKVFLKIKMEDEEQFFIHTRMSLNVYDLLFSLIKNFLKCPKQKIGPEERLSITLLYLAFGNSFQSIAWSYKLGKATVRQIVLGTCEVLWSVLSTIYLSEPTSSQYKEISNDFKKICNMPNCVGAIYITCPKNSGSMFFKYIKFYSIVLMATCYPKYTFTMASIGSYGSQSDGGVFQHSNFGRALLGNQLPLPSRAPLGNGLSESFPHYFVGDAAFPLKINLMRPFSGSLLPQMKGVFNYRLSRARRVIENPFGILTARWRVLRSPIECSPENCEKIVLGCIVLHNFIMLSYCKRWYCPDGYTDWENTDGDVEDGNWRNDLASASGKLHFIASHRRNASTVAYELRNILAEHFMNEGAVPFQYRHL